MNNREIPLLETDEILLETEETTQEPASGKESHQFKPGQSGNPAGRPRMTSEEKKIRAMFTRLGPKAVRKIEEMLDMPKLSSIAKVRIIEIILERAYGKVESNVKVTETRISMEEAQSKVEEALDRIRREKEIQ